MSRTLSGVSRRNVRVASILVPIGFLASLTAGYLVTTEADEATKRPQHYTHTVPLTVTPGIAPMPTPVPMPSVCPDIERDGFCDEIGTAVSRDRVKPSKHGEIGTAVSLPARKGAK